eukprot:3989259-Pyramimonas_sp.AAC.1
MELNDKLWEFVKTGLEEIPGHPDFGTDLNQAIHLDQQRGWLLLQRSRLSPTERAAVISSVKGNFDYDSIGEQLRVSWPGDELTNRDKNQGEDHRRRERGRIHAGWGHDEADGEIEDCCGYCDESGASCDTQPEEDTEDPDGGHLQRLGDRGGGDCPRRAAEKLRGG